MPFEAESSEGCTSITDSRFDAVTYQAIRRLALSMASTIPKSTKLSAQTPSTHPKHDEICGERQVSKDPRDRDRANWAAEVHMGDIQFVMQPTAFQQKTALRYRLAYRH